MAAIPASYFYNELSTRPMVVPVSRVASEPHGHHISRNSTISVLVQGILRLLEYRYLVGLNNRFQMHRKSLRPAVSSRRSLASGRFTYEQETLPRQRDRPLRVGLCLLHKTSLPAAAGLGHRAAVGQHGTFEHVTNTSTDKKADELRTMPCNVAIIQVGLRRSRDKWSYLQEF